MALQTDHRPRNLNELSGNEILKKSLGAMLKRTPETRHHAILFTGPKGCGKTTLARIVASYLKCQEFNEIDASDESGGVSAARELKRTVRYPPMRGDSRIWFIDECHKLTKSAQEAFLKLLEEPPAHAYFVLATTDPQKLLATFRDRCAIFEVKPLSNKEMKDFLLDICDAEKVDLPPKVLNKIVSDSNGHPRAALQILERVIDLPEKDMEAAIVQTEELEVASIDLARALMEKGSSWKQIAPLVKGIEDYENARHVILGYCQTILLSGKDDPYTAKAALTMSYMEKAFYDSKKPGFSLACYNIFFDK